MEAGFDGNVSIDRIRELMHGTQAFKLRMVSGRVVEVPHPDFAALTPNGSSLVVTTKNEWFEVIRLNQVECIEAPDIATGT